MTSGLGGYGGLNLDPNDDCEDILEVLMKQKCQKCPQTQHLNKNEANKNLIFIKMGDFNEFERSRRASMM